MTSHDREAIARGLAHLLVSQEVEAQAPWEFGSAEILDTIEVDEAGTQGDCVILRGENSVGGRVRIDLKVNSVQLDP